MAVNLRNISDQTGLSYQTVANVLSGSPERRGRHTQETQDRVLEAASRLGYLPNRAARAVKTGRFGSFALLLSSQESCSYLPSRLLDGILNELAESETTLSVTRLPDGSLGATGNASEVDELLPSFLRERACDGLLVDITHRVASRVEQAIESSSLPNVWLNTCRPQDAVYPDDYRAGCLAARSIIDAGHRRIGYLQLQHGRQVKDSTEWHYSVFARQDGVEQTLRRAGLLRESSMQDHAIAPALRIDFAARLLRREDRPTAIVTYSDAEAVAVVIAAHAVGLVVPRDLSIVTLADQRVDSVGTPLQTYMADRDALGRRAARMLFRKLDRPGPVKSEAIPPLSLPGHSVASPLG
jgi:DNA-binding LacI/PurR family transcriptional regulator